MVKCLRSPILWFGGKGNMVAKILPLLEVVPHTRYVEPFGGGASVLLAKRPMPVETYNDLNGALVNFFRVLADPDLFREFYPRVWPLPCSRALYNEYWDAWRDESDPVKQAAQWFYVARQSFSGRFGSGWSSAVTASSRGRAGTASRWQSTLDMLPAIHERLQRVQIECADWRTIIERYDTPETLFYLDPPYVPDTRSAGKYAHELTADDHRNLVTALRSLKGHAVLSGYPNEIYAPLEAAGWQRIDWQTSCHATGRTRHTKIQGDGAALKMQARTECVWISPGAQLQEQQSLAM